MNWYCVHTRPGKEEQAAAYLRSQFGLEVYFPRLKRRKTVRRARRAVISPLFPRYFFSRLELAENYRAVRYSPDILGIVSFGREPAVVSEALVDELRRWAGNAGDLIPVDPDLRPGDEVKVVAGPMQGLRAVVLRAKDDRARVTLLLSLLELPAQVVIDRENLEKGD